MPRRPVPCSLLAVPPRPLPRAAAAAARAARATRRVCRRAAPRVLSVRASVPPAPLVPLITPLPPGGGGGLVPRLVLQRKEGGRPGEGE
eukprot:scaffold117508_cov33-Phaeocystis_antarctica.AAC.2